MLDHHPVHNLFLVAVVFPLRLRIPIHPRAYGPPCLHRRCVLIHTLSRDPRALENGTLHKRYKLHVVVSISEVEQRQGRVAMLVWRRLEYAVDGGLVVAPREHLHRVADIDDLGRQRYTVKKATPAGMGRAYNAIRNVSDIAPFSIRTHDLQGDDGLVPQQRDGPAVSMALHPDVLRPLLVLG